MGKPEMAMVHDMHPTLRDGKIVNAPRVRGPVRVMARADGYAMVRLPRCLPFVVSEKDLRPVSKPDAHP